MMVVCCLISVVCLWVLLFGLSVFIMRTANIKGIIKADTADIIMASVFVPLFAIVFVLAVSLAKKVQ